MIINILLVILPIVSIAMLLLGATYLINRITKGKVHKSTKYWIIGLMSILCVIKVFTSPITRPTTNNMDEKIQEVQQYRSENGSSLELPKLNNNVFKAKDTADNGTPLFDKANEDLKKSLDK